MPYLQHLYFSHWLCSKYKDDITLISCVLPICICLYLCRYENMPIQSQGDLCMLILDKAYLVSKLIYSHRPANLAKIPVWRSISFWSFSEMTVMEVSGTWWRHKMKTFSALLAICAGNPPVPVNSPHEGQWRGALMFSLICVWIIGWVNNREAGDLRRYRAHCDVIVIRF